MRIFLIAAIVSLFGFISLLNATSARDVVIQTIDSNPDIMSEKINKEAFKRYIDEQKGDYLPRIDLNAYTEDLKTTRDIDGGSSSSATNIGWDATLKLEQILYDGGLTPSEVEEYKHKYQANKFRSNARVEQIIRKAVDSYLDLVTSQELKSLSDVNLKRHEDYLATAQQKETISGEILETHQINSKKHFILDQFLEQEELIANANSRYERYTQSKLEGNICRPNMDEELIPNTLEKTLEIAIVSNYKILEQIEKIKEQRENIIQAQSANLPTIKFQLQSSWNKDLELSPYEGREDTRSVRLLLNWNIFKGFKTKAAVEREKLFLQEQQKLLDEVTNEVIQDVTIAYNVYFKAKQRISNFKEFVKENKNIKNIYLKQLADGTRTFIDILNAESELYRSQLDEIELDMNLYRLYYDLLDHIGMFSDSILISKPQSCGAFVKAKYRSSIKKDSNTNQIDQLDDLDLLQELGDDSTKTDDDINSFINSVDDTPPTITENSSENILPLLGKYTINVATLKMNQDVEKFKRKMNLMDKDIYSYKMSLGIKVLHGSYDTLKEAKEAMNGFNQEVYGLKVYVDNLEKHHKLLKKYSHIN